MKNINTNKESNYISNISNLIESSKLTYDYGMELINSYNSLSDEEQTKLDELSINELPINIDSKKVDVKESLNSPIKSSTNLETLKKTLTPWFIICLSYSFIRLLIYSTQNLQEDINQTVLITSSTLGLMIISLIFSLIIGVFTKFKNYRKNLLWTTSLLGLFSLISFI